MAFNPFHSFRKHQKPVLAVLAIVCMFLFILTGFAGDFVQRALSWFGAGRNRGQQVTTLYGNPVYEGDLQEVQRHRLLASQFLYLAARQAGQKLRDEKKAPEFGRTPGKGQMRAQMMEQFGQPLYFGTMHPGPGGGGGLKAEDNLDFLIWKHEADKLGIVLSDDQVIRLINKETPGVTVMGKRWSDDPLVLGFLMGQRTRGARQTGTVSPDELLNAVRDEFRVLMAQEILLGEEPGFLGLFSRGGLLQSPEVPTPDEAYRAYRDNRTALKVALLPVPAADFPPKDQPTEKELQALFEQGKDRLAAPDSPLPGFRIPRKVRVQYAAFRADQAAYRDQAFQELLLPYLRLLLPPTMTVPGAGAAAWVQTAEQPWLLGQDVKPGELSDLLRIYRMRSYAVQTPPSSTTAPGVDVADLSSLGHPGLFRSGVVGLTMGHAGGLHPAGAFGVLSAWIATAQRYDNGERRWNYKVSAVAMIGQIVGQAGCPSMTFGVGAVPLGVWTLQERGYPTREAEGRMVEERVLDVAQRLMDEDVATLDKVLRDFKSRPKEAAEFVAALNEGKPVKIGPAPPAGKADDRPERRFPGLKGRIFTMEKARDRYALVDDPAMSDLRAAWNEAVAHEERPAELGEYLLRFEGLYQPQIWSESTQRAGPQPEARSTAWLRDPNPFVIWLVGEEREHPPADLAEVRSQVEAAWRLREGRKQARTEARKLLEDFQARKFNPRTDQEVSEMVAALRDEGAKLHLPPVIQLGEGDHPLARLVPMKTAQPDPLGRPQLAPYQPPASIPYPPANFVDVLMRLNKPGDALIVPDRGERTSYVAVLLSRREPTEKEFLDEYTQVTGMMRQDSQQRYYQDVIRQLRAEASKVDPDTGRYILPKDLGSNREGED